MENKALTRLAARYQRATRFEAMLPGVKFYRFDWFKYIPEESFDDRLNPSFSKASANVQRARGFWEGLYKSLTGTHSNTEANHYNLYDVVSQTKGEKLQSVIQFVSMKSEEMAVLHDIASNVLKGKFSVLTLNGSEHINGVKVTGRSVEGIVKDTLLLGLPVWIIASNLCQRSFSIPEINATILTYDKGDEGATIQKMSRSQTPGALKTYGHVFSMSIDGNRDDKIGTIVLDAAKNNTNKTGEDIIKSIKKVLHTLPIFQMVDGDIEALSVDEYSKELFGSTTAHHAIINTKQLVKLNFGDVSFGLLSGVKLSKLEKDQIEVAFAKGKTFKSTEQNKRTVSISEKDVLQLMRENLRAITDRLNYAIRLVKGMQPELTFAQFQDLLETSQNLQEIVKVSRGELDALISENYIDGNLFSVLVNS